MIHKINQSRFFGSCLLISTIVLMAACGNRKAKPDVSTVEVTVKAQRFDQDLFASDLSDLNTSLAKLKQRYESFFDLFAYQVTTLGSRDTALMADRFRTFLSDTNFIAIHKECDKQFGDFSPWEKELTQSFRYYKYYFPDKQIPQIMTLISAFSYPVICDSTHLGISLDMYLGRDYYYYGTIDPPLPMYLRRRMDPAFLVTDAMRGWAMSDYWVDESGAKLVDMMVAEGRIMYFLDQVLPDVADSLKSGYTQKQLEWCRSNESKVWSFFIAQNMLFSSDPNLLLKYANDGPTTNGFPKESPGNIARFCGWKIVNSYMKKHPDVTLEALMQEKDAGKIFNESGYKPAK